MLYSGHFLIADTQIYHIWPFSNIFVSILPLYSGHLLIADSNTGSRRYPLMRGLTAYLYDVEKISDESVINLTNIPPALKSGDENTLQQNSLVIRIITGCSNLYQHEDFSSFSAKIKEIKIAQHLFFS